MGLQSEKKIFRNDWAEDVKRAINGFLSSRGSESAYHTGNDYVVFDFDNTITVFDVEEQLFAYQLLHMAFEFTPGSLALNIRNRLSVCNDEDWIEDILHSYEYLYDKYGPFHSCGVTENLLQSLYVDKQWQEFSAKTRAFYDYVDKNEHYSVAFPWFKSWFAGMTENSLYELAMESSRIYSSIPASYVEWSSPDDIISKKGSVSCRWIKGIAVPENMIELLKALKGNDIKVWICSASAADVVRGGVDALGLHEYVTGVIGMTIKKEGGHFVNGTDCTACGWLSCENGTWQRDIFPIKSVPQERGKVDAIKNVLYKRYKQGPSAAFMDSKGDVNFCTEFSSLQLVVCMNRADRSVMEGAGLIAEIAVYQKNNLGYDFNTAKKNSDTLYVLQGRDENGVPSFINDNMTIRLDESYKRLFCDERNFQQLNFIINQKLTTEQAINRFLVKKTNDKDNELRFDYGAFTSYDGYHSK